MTEAVQNSVAFWPQREVDPNFRALPADPGFWDTMGSQWDMAWRHSPFMSVYRSQELFLEKVERSPRGSYDLRPMISADEANERYGLNGLLKFDEPITPSAAQLMMERKLEEQELEFISGTGLTTTGRRIAGLGTSMGATLVDPINLGSMFLPIVSEARAFNMARKIGGKAWQARLIKGSIEGVVGNAMVEPLVLLPAAQEQSHYGLRDSAVNLGFGAILGGALHVGIGAAADVAVSRKMNRFVENMQAVTKYIDELPDKDQQQIYRAAFADILEDKPVSGPGRLVELTDKAITDEIKWDAAKVRKDVERRLGFDVDQPKKWTVYETGEPGNKGYGPHDPQPNEPWYHGRGAEEVSFDSDRPAFFTRDPDATQFYNQETGPGVEPGKTFVANLETTKPAATSDIHRIGVQLFGEDALYSDFGGVNFDTEAGQALSDALQRQSPYSGENLNDLVYLKEVREVLESEGFDSLLTSDMFLNDEIDTLVVWNPKQIRTPGTKSKKTATGLEWKAVTTDIDAQVKKLREAKIKNMINQERKKFQKQKALREQEVKIQKAQDPHVFNKNLEDATLQIQKDIQDLSTELGGRPVQEEVSPAAKVEEPKVEAPEGKTGAQKQEKVLTPEDDDMRAMREADELLAEQEEDLSFMSPEESELYYEFAEGLDDLEDRNMAIETAIDCLVKYG